RELQGHAVDQIGEPHPPAPSLVVNHRHQPAAAEPRLVDPVDAPSDDEEVIPYLLLPPGEGACVAEAHFDAGRAEGAALIMDGDRSGGPPQLPFQPSCGVAM